MVLKVKEVKKESPSAFSLIFEKPDNFNFYPGQYLELELPEGSRSFTISSSPTENFLMIATKKGVSEFKKRLEKLKADDTINCSHPLGTFTLDENSPAVFMTGGIGITPFRSMIKYVVEQRLNTPIILIYSNSDEDFIFKRELDIWQKLLPNLQIIYHNSFKDGRFNKNALKTKLPITNYQLPIFYLSGLPKMVDDFAKNLLELGVDEVNIRYDRFDGY